MTFEEEMKQKKQELIKELNSTNSIKESLSNTISKYEESIKEMEREKSVLSMKLEWLESRNGDTKEVKEKLIKVKDKIKKAESCIKDNDLYLHDLSYRPAYLEGEIKRLENLGF